MAEISARLSLDSSAFTKGLDAALGKLSSFSGQISAVAGKAAAALSLIGVPLSAGAFALGIKNAVEFGEEMSNLSARTGIAVRDLVILGRAFESSGLGADGVGQAVNKLQKALTGVNERGEPTNKTFEKLGLNMQELRALAPAEQFQRVGAAIANLKDPAERAAAAMAIFGKSGGEMLALFRDPEAIAQATQQVGAQADMLQKNAAAMKYISDAFGAVKSTLRGFFVGLVEPLLPYLTKISQWLNEIAGKAVAFGQKLGQYIAAGLNILRNGFQQGKLGELAGLSLKIAFGEAANYLGGILLGIIDGLGKALAAILQAVFSGDTIRPALQLFLAIPEILIGGIIAGMARVAGALKGVMAFVVQELVNLMPAKLRKYLTGTDDKGTLTLSEHIAVGQKGLAGAAANFGDNLIKDAIARFGDAGKRIGETIGKIVAAFRSADFSPVQMFNTAEWKAQLAALAQQLNVPLEAVQQFAKQAAQAGGELETTTKGTSERKMDVDQFAKIGLFAGGGGAASAIEKTADHTRQMVEMMRNGIKLQQQIVAVAA